MTHIADTQARPRGVALLVLAYSLLLAAWVGGHPAMGGADEWQHYARSLSVAGGELVGEPAPYTSDSSLSPDALAWVEQASREVDVPAGMAPAGYGCNAFVPTESAACQNLVPPSAATSLVIPNGTYQPWPYLLPGLVARVPDTPEAALLMGRTAAAVMVLALLGLSAATFPGGAGARVAGIAIAMSPMVLHVGATLSPSGLEIAAAVALVAAGMRLTADPAAGATAWATATGAGVALALSRSISLLWLAVLMLLLVALASRRWISSIFEHRRSWLLGAAIAVAGAAGINRAWEAAYGPVVTISLSPIGESLRDSISQLPTVLRQQIGAFGYLDSSPPEWAYLLWAALLAVLVGYALRVARWRGRLVIGVTLLAAFAAPVLLDAAILRHTGFGVQGRHTLALTVAVPLVAAYLAADAMPRYLPPALTIGAAVVHLTAWWVNAQRHAVGTDGPIFFVGRSEWAPPGGWAPWTLAAIAGAILLVVVGWRALAPSARSSDLHEA